MEWNGEAEGRGLWAEVSRGGGDQIRLLNTVAQDARRHARRPPAPWASSCHIQISFQSLFHRNLPPFGPSIGLISSAPLRFPRARPPPQSPRRLPAARPISANPMPRVFSIRTHPTHLYQHRVLFTISGARAGRGMQLQSKLSAT